MESRTGDQPRATPEQLIQVFQTSTVELKPTLQDSCTSLRNEIFQPHSDSKEALTQQIKDSNSEKWKKEGNRKQFEFNTEVIDSLNKATEAIKTGNAVSCSAGLEQAMKKLTLRQKLIRLADSSDSSWETVKEYETNDLASDSEDEKRINRAEAQAARKLSGPDR